MRRSGKPGRPPRDLAPRQSILRGPRPDLGPLLLLARLLPAAALGLRVAGSCRGLLPALVLTATPLLAALALYCGYRIARRFVDDAPAALATALIGLCGNLLAYATVMPSYSHAYAALGVSLVFLASLRASEQASAGPESRGRWALAGLALSFAILQRAPCVVFGLVPAALLWSSFRGRWRAAIWPALSFLLAASIGPLLQLSVYRYLYGSPWVQPQGPHYLQLAHAHPWLALFAPHGGLFPTSPVAWLAVVGACLLARSGRSRPLLLGALFAAFLDLYIASSALDWDGAATYGARRLTTWTPLLIWLTAFACARLRDLLVAHPGAARVGLALLALAPAAFGNIGAVWGLSRSQMPLSLGLTQSRLYGTGTALAWSLVDDRLGTLASLPAALVFCLRYGLPLSAFVEATDPSWYNRNYRTLLLSRNDLPLSTASLQHSARGMYAVPSGLVLGSPHASLVFSTIWPHATRLQLQASAARCTRVRVGRRSFWGVTTWYGETPIHCSDPPADLAIPPGTFDSGLTELLFETDDPGATLHKLILLDDASYGPPIDP